MKKVVNWIDRYIEEVILCVLLLALTSVMFMQIVLRYVFSSTLAWPEEFCRYCFIYTAFFAIPFCIKRHSMLCVDIIVNFFPKKIKRLFDMAAELMSLVLWSFLWYHSWFVLLEAMKNTSYSMTMGIPLYWIYGMPFVALFFAVVRQVQRIILVFIQLWRKQAPGDENKRGEEEVS